MNGENAKDSPIGIFDSGVGGISVLKALEKELPHENFLFYGDQKNAPYGEKTEEEVRALSLSAYRSLAIPQHPLPLPSFVRNIRKILLWVWSRP